MTPRAAYSFGGTGDEASVDAWTTGCSICVRSDTSAGSIAICAVKSHN